MATTVLLRVTPPEAVDPLTLPPDTALPTDLGQVLVAAGQPTVHGFSRSGTGPWRWEIHLSGPDRLRAGRDVVQQLRRLGYQADLVVSR